MFEKVITRAIVKEAINKFEKALDVLDPEEIADIGITMVEAVANNADRIASVWLDSTTKIAESDKFADALVKCYEVGNRVNRRIKALQKSEKVIEAENRLNAAETVSRISELSDGDLVEEHFSTLSHVENAKTAVTMHICKSENIEARIMNLRNGGKDEAPDESKVSKAVSDLTKNTSTILGFPKYPTTEPKLIEAYYSAQADIRSNQDLIARELRKDSLILAEITSRNLKFF